MSRYGNGVSAAANWYAVAAFLAHVFIVVSSSVQAYTAGDFLFQKNARDFLWPWELSAIVKS
jgi:hypothetical protein